MRPTSTRYSFFISKSPANLVDFINALPFMVEIKGDIQKDGKVYRQCFVFPDDISQKQFESLHKFDIDKGEPSA